LIEFSDCKNFFQIRKKLFEERDVARVVADVDELSKLFRRPSGFIRIRNVAEISSIIAFIYSDCIGIRNVAEIIQIIAVIYSGFFRI
jgi:hypothetical protein